MEENIIKKKVISITYKGDENKANGNHICEAQKNMW
jgi:hypothetical protein